MEGDEGGGGSATNSIDVKVKYNGETIPVSVSPDSTVAELKSLIHPITNVLPRGQTLIFKGKLLLDSMTLRSSQVSNLSKIMLLASQGLHQGSAPVRKEAPSIVSSRAVDTFRKAKEKQQQQQQQISVEKTRSELWKATGVIALSECSLKAIPDQVWTCGTSARVFDLSNNYIQDVPVKISRLSSIQKLHLNANNITDESISWEGIACLKSLVVLSLSQNQLTALPSALGGLVSLRQLYVANNQLVHLPVEIGLLARVEILKVNCNRLSTIPPSIGDCCSLIELDISSNLLKELPQTMGNLQNMKILHLNNNGLYSLPLTLFKTCTELSTLNLHATEITIDLLRQYEGWGDFDERRRLKHQKQLDFRVGGCADFDEGADKR